MAAHKYWRLKNIKINIGIESLIYLAVAEIRFNDITSYLPANAFSLNAGAGSEAYKAFDANKDTIAHQSGSYANQTTSAEWYIGYKFDAPIDVMTVSLQMRQDLPSSYDRSWQTADVEYSDDGANWFKYGYIEPKFAKNDLSLKTVDVIKFASIGGKSLQDNGTASRFVIINDWQTGDFLKKIVPNADGSWNYSPPNKNKLIVTHIGAEGFAPQTDAPITPA